MSDVNQPADEFLTPEELILQLSGDELMELLSDMGFNANESTVHGIRTLVRELGSLDAAIVALHDDRIIRRAA